MTINKFEYNWEDNVILVNIEDIGNEDKIYIYNIKTSGNESDYLDITDLVDGNEGVDIEIESVHLKEKFFNSAYILKAISDNKSIYKSILVIPKYEKCALNKLANLSTCSDCLEELSIPAINVFNIIEALKISLDLGYFNEAFSFINTLDKVCEGDCRDCGNYKL